MRVLVVDDDRDSRAIFSAALQAGGHEVCGAADGVEGLRLAGAWSPDLILMDLSVPGIDGWEATRRLKGSAATREIPVVAVSAHTLPEHERRALEVGCCRYLRKPVLPRQLVQVVSELAHQV